MAASRKGCCIPGCTIGCCFMLACLHLQCKQDVKKEGRRMAREGERRDHGLRRMDGEGEERYETMSVRVS